MSYLNTYTTLFYMQNVDSTSYIYANSGKPVPLADYFFNVQYVNSNGLLEQSGAGKLVAVVKDEKVTDSSSIKLQFTDAILIILIGLLALIAFVRISGKNYLNRIFTSIINFAYSNSFFKEKNLAYTLNNNILLFVFFASSGLLLKLIIEYFNFPGLAIGPWNQIMMYSLITVSFFVIYRLSYRFLGVVIGNNAVASEYLFFFNNLLKILGIIYVILLFGSYFTVNTGKIFFIYISIFITFFAYFIKLYRIFIIFFKNRFSLYYLILYFCALEIIPIILLVKILSLINQGKDPLMNLLV